MGKKQQLIDRILKLESQSSSDEEARAKRYVSDMLYDFTRKLADYVDAREKCGAISKDEWKATLAKSKGLARKYLWIFAEEYSKLFR